MGKTGNLSHFDRAVDVVVRQAGQKLLIQWDFPTQPSVQFTGPKKSKYPVSGRVKSTLLKPEVSGETAGADRKTVTINPITTNYNEGIQRSISERTTRQTLIDHTGCLSCKLRK